MAEYLQPIELYVGVQGQLVLPASLRRAWQLEAGEVLWARLEDNRLILEKTTQILQRVKERYAALRSQPSLADELIAERRAEAKREDTL